MNYWIEILILVISGLLVVAGCGVWFYVRWRRYEQRLNDLIESAGRDHYLPELRNSGDR